MRSTLSMSAFTPVGKAASSTSTLGTLLLLLGLAGCGGSEPVAPGQITTPEALFVKLALSHRAINLSTVASYNTFQLTATPLNGLGVPMTGLSAPSFRSTDTTKVKVSADGLLTAVQAGAGVRVIAELTAPGNMRRADTAVINVNATTDPPPVLATLSINPVSPDSAFIPISGAIDFSVFGWASAISLPFFGAPTITRYRRALTSGGDSIPGLVVEYESLDPAIAFINVIQGTGYIGRVRPGLARLVIRTVAYGVSKADTAVFTVTPPAAQSVIVKQWGGGLSIFGPTLTIRPNGIITWANQLQPIDVVFDDPTSAGQPPAVICTIVQVSAPNACGTGNFTVPKDEYRIRQFPLPGTYTYRDIQTGTVGHIVVTDGLTPSASSASPFSAGRP